MVICQITHPACSRETGLKWAECNSVWVGGDAVTNGSDPIAWCHDPTAAVRSLFVGGPEQPTWGYQNLALGVWTCGQPRQSPSECVFLLEPRHKSVGNNFGNQSEQDIVFSPLLLLKRNILNTNLKDKSGYCACAVTAFQRNLNGIFFILLRT